MIGKDPGWSNYFRLIELFSDLTNSFQFHSHGASQEKFLKNGEIWKELDQTKKMWPTGIFSDHPFRSYSCLKMTCLKRNIKTASFFVTSDSRFLISWIKLAAISKQFKIGGSYCAHFLRLFGIIPGIMNFFNFQLCKVF